MGYPTQAESIDGLEPCNSNRNHDEFFHSRSNASAKCPGVLDPWIPHELGHGAVTTGGRVCQLASAPGWQDACESVPNRGILQRLSIGSDPWLSLAPPDPLPSAPLSRHNARLLPLLGRALLAP